MASHGLQILVVIDLYPVVSVDELKKELPDQRDDRVVLRLTDPEFGAPRLEPPPDDALVDWPAIGRAVEALGARVRALHAGEPTRTVLFVGGRGPLAVFIHLGYLFAKFGGHQVVLNQPPGGGRWEHFDMNAPVAAGTPRFDERTGLPADPVLSSGRVGISVDTAGREMPDEVFTDLIESEGDGVAGIVKIRYPGALLVSPEHISAIAQQFAQWLSMAPSRFPRRSGLAIFFGGPAQLAFVLGRSLNPTVVGRVLLTNFRHPTYERVYELPFLVEQAPTVPCSDGDEVARRRILDTMIAAIEELRTWLKPEHLPADVLPAGDRGKFIERLGELVHVRQESDSFEMGVLRGQYTLGAGLLHAFCGSPEHQVKDAAKLLLLHELLHHWQDIRSTNHFNVGRAGVVLEQVDFAADAFALRALMSMELDVGGQRARGAAREILRRLLEACLHGVESFDRMEQGATIKRLPERRLRRYLAWHLQLARASAVSDASHADELLRPALTVELAPLIGRIDTQRYEKVVLRALDTTELFCAIGGHLVREPRRPGFDPGALVEAVRSYAGPVIQRAMLAVVDEHRARLAPWRS